MVEGESSSGMHKLFACVVNISIRSSAHLKQLFCHFGSPKKRTRTKYPPLHCPAPIFAWPKNKKWLERAEKSTEMLAMQADKLYMLWFDFILGSCIWSITLEHSPDVAPGERRGRGGGYHGSDTLFQKMINQKWIKTLLQHCFLACSLHVEGISHAHRRSNGIYPCTIPIVAL